MHVTLRVRAGLPSLRSKAAHTALLAAILACNDRFGLRVVHYVALSNHLHLICEANDDDLLRRGASALVVGLAHALNKIWNRSGPVFGDRFHARSLSSPREVRNVLAYVLLNAEHHGLHIEGGLDPCSSAAWFDGWMDEVGRAIPPRSVSPLSAPQTWLLSIGWKSGSLIERPEAC